jgi:hypothetical protein
MTAQTPKRFVVTVVEVLVHSNTVTATDERDANELVREMWDETGPAGFHTHPWFHGTQHYRRGNFMTGIIRYRRVRLKTFDVSYYLKQGFTISVRASSAARAERMVRKMLDEGQGQLEGSSRIHYDDGIVGVDEVLS